jgi:hypothetical protein
LTDQACQYYDKYQPRGFIFALRKIAIHITLEPENLCNPELYPTIGRKLRGMIATLRWHTAPGEP